jgi:hypothetical protein
MPWLVTTDHPAWVQLARSDTNATEKVSAEVEGSSETIIFVGKSIPSFSTVPRF